MEKQSFRTLVKKALERSRDGKLMWLVFLGVLCSCIAFLPNLIVLGIIIWRIHQCDAGSSFNAVMGLGALYLITHLLGFWLTGVINCGIQREVLYPPPTRIGRAFRNGFARMLKLLYLIPWLIVSVIVVAAQNCFLNGTECRTAGGWLFLILIILVNIAVGIVMLFLFSGIAAGSPSIKFGPLYANAFRAFRNGWGRTLLGYLVCFGFGVLCVLALLPGIICYAVGTMRNDSSFLIASAILFVAWAVAMIFAMLKLWCFSIGYFIHLYLDAAQVEPELETAEDAVPEPTAAESVAGSGNPE